jgi:hypothetical protein
MRASELESVLALLPYFARLRPEERLRIAARFTPVRLVAGAAYPLDADRPELVVIVSGEADLEREGQPPQPLFAGDTVGDEAVVIARGLGGRIVAREPTELAHLDHTGVESLLADYPAVAPPWVRALGRELKWRNDLLREVSLAYAEQLPPAQLQAVLARRRRRLQHHRRSPLRRVGAGLYHTLLSAPGSRPSFWVLVGALTALAAARTVVAVIIKNGLQKHLFALIGGKAGNPIHVHHFNYGLALVSLVGVLVLMPRPRRLLRRLAFVFGFGVGLIVDEFALLWNLNPDYYQPESRLAAGLVILTILQVVYLRAFWIGLVRRVAASVRQ